MPAPMIKENWANLLEPGIREQFFIGYERRPSLLSRFFDVMTSNKSSEYMLGSGAIGIDAWDQFEKTGVVPTVGYDQGYKATWTHKTMVLELPINVDLWADDQYAVINDSAQRIGDSAALKREYDRASVFNNAFSASYLGPDSVALCSDSHPNGPTVSGTQDNNFTLSLSKTNVRTIREAMQAFKDDRGQLVAVTPNALVVPPALEDDAKEIAQSVLDPTSANNTVNPQFGRWEVITDHYLTDTNAWFMVDTMLMKQSLKWFDREPLSIVLDRVEKRVMAFYNARMRYSYGWRDWRWIAGSNPS